MDLDFTQWNREEAQDGPTSLVQGGKSWLEKFSVHELVLKEMKERATAIEVKDEATAAQATTLGVEAARLVKKIEAEEKALVSEPNKFVKAVRAMAKKYTEPLESVKDTLRGKIRDHQSRVELERRKAEEATRRAAAELQRKLDADAAEANRIAMENARRIAEEKAAAERKLFEEEAAKAKSAEDAQRIMEEAEQRRKEFVTQAEKEALKNAIKAPEVPLPMVPKAKGPTRGEEGGSASQRSVWLFEILNQTEIPPEFMKPDEIKIRQAIKMGMRSIPGVRIFEESGTVFRT